MSGRLVLVTGGTGFISSWTIKYLLEQGLTVRTTVRTPAKAQFLKELPGAAERLELVSADLNSPDSWPATVNGCAYVLHIASPFVINVKDPQRDLVTPAVNGTLNVLKACKDCETVKRVILTSSVAAVGDSFDDWKTHVYTDKDWNTTSSLKRNAYHYSKTLAEKAAHEFMEKEKPNFTLAVINPFVVIGPSLDPAAPINQSIEIIASILAGKYPFNLPVSFGMVDVRDVAIAHIRAMESEEAIGKRFILCAETFHMQELSKIIKEVAPKNLARRIPTRSPPPFLIKSVIVTFAGLTQGWGTATFVSTSWGKHPTFDVSPAKDILKIEFRDIKESVQETVKWALDNKLHKRKF